MKKLFSRSNFAMMTLLCVVLLGIVPPTVSAKGLKILGQESYLPDIKANASDSPITVSTEDTVSIAIGLDINEAISVTADWWLLELTPTGTLNYVDLVTASFLPGSATTYQGSLFGFSSIVLLNLSNLAVGSHTFFFGVDTNMNASLDILKLYYDFVVVNVDEVTPDAKFDGIWYGRAISTTPYDKYGDECGFADTKLEINGKQITGSAVDSPWNEQYTISGDITAEGNITLGLGYGDEGTVASFTGLLSADSGSGIWEDNYKCSGTWSMSKQQN